MDLEQTAIERLKVAAGMSEQLFKMPLVITYSGGKDSDVLLHLAEKSGIKYEVIHSINNDNEEGRRLFETCRLKGRRVVNPIVDWGDEDVLGYAEAEHIGLNPLYCEGFKRIGCIGCPMARQKGRNAEFRRWPKYKLAYIRAFDRMLDERKKRELPSEWQTGEDVFHWWMEDGVMAGQIYFEGFGENDMV